MAIAKMSHVRLVGLRRDQNKILDILASRGMFEARATDCIDVQSDKDGSDAFRALKLKQSKISFALGFLKSRHAVMAAALKKPLTAENVFGGTVEYTLGGEKYSNAKMPITKADFSDAAAREYDLMHVCDELEKISFDITEAGSRISALDAMCAAYEPYTTVPFKLSEIGVKGDISLNIYYAKSQAAPPTDVLDSLPCAYEVRKNDTAFVVTLPPDKANSSEAERAVPIAFATGGSGGTVILTVSRKHNADEVNKRLCALGFSPCPFDDDCTAEQKINALYGEIADLKRRTAELTKTALGYEKHVKDLRILYDVIELDIERAEAEQKFLKTDSTFLLEGWLPEHIVEQTVAEVTESYPNTLVQLLAPEQKDAPPTLVLNNKAVAPYESITNMYSPPKYREIDPNPIMAVFYFLFFGIMIGDAGYGLILAIAGFVIGLSKRFDTGFKKLALLVGMGGISAIFWGILFGGYFSIDFGEKNVALLLNPLDKPLLLLVLSIAFGCVQMIAGYVIKFVALCKEGKPFSAIFDAGSIILLFIALGLLAVAMLPSLAPMLDIEVGFTPPEGLKTAAIVFALAGVALILIFGGRNSKNVFGKVVGGFKGLYGLVNLLSDLLSYCRLFGLCLASCAIGLAFNSLGEIIMGIPGVGYVLGAIVLAVLHLFNLALGVLSAYVHDARLQFLEFYGKFYEGGGRLFAPLGSRTKYIRYD